MIVYEISAAIFDSSAGPGLLESAYEAALTYELKKHFELVETQISLPMIYEEVKVEVGYRLDILVNRKVIIELKSVENLLERTASSRWNW